MSVATVKEIVERWRHEYDEAGKAGKSAILGELQRTTGFHRKSLLRLLAKGAAVPAEKVDRRRGSRYAVILPPLHTIWEAHLCICGKRLQPHIPEVMPVMLEKGELQATPIQQELLLSVSAATIDRLLGRHRRQLGGHGRATTRPGTLLREHIPIRTFSEWNEQRPGFLEVDLVAHCGGSAAGEYLHTLCMTDVFTGWVTLGAMKGKGQHGTVAAIDGAQLIVPFPVLGLDCDNGSEFINAHLVRYCDERRLTFTRSRPYKKNDQCHVEQKNWTVVRHFFGYKRFETDEQLALLKEIQPLVVRYHNFFLPMMRLVSKERQGSKVKRVYDKAKTPYLYLMAQDDALTQEQREQLEAEYHRYGPVALLREIRVRLQALMRTSVAQDVGGTRNRE